MISPTVEALRPIVQEFASRLQSIFPEKFRDDKNAAEFKEAVVQCVKSTLPPHRRPGRPPQDAITRATMLYQQKKGWKAILENPVIKAALVKSIESQKDAALKAMRPDFDEETLLAWLMEEAKSRLRDAVRSRIKRSNQCQKKCRTDKLF
jgi:hypothetical protein